MLGVRRGQVSTDAERSCDSTPLQLRTVYVLQAAELHADQWGFFFGGVLQLPSKLAIQKKQRLLWVFFTFAPQRQDIWLFIEAPHSFRKAVHKEVRSQQAVYSLLSCSSLPSSCILVGRRHDATEGPLFILFPCLHPDSYHAVKFASYY